MLNLVWFALLQSMRQIAKALRVFAYAENFPVIVHCIHGALLRHTANNNHLRRQAHRRLGCCIRMRRSPAPAHRAAGLSAHSSARDENPAIRASDAVSEPPQHLHAQARTARG